LPPTTIHTHAQDTSPQASSLTQVTFNLPGLHALVCSAHQSPQ